MTDDWQTVFILGPPAAGKSTLGRAAAEQLGVRFRTIDEWTPRGVPMTDAQVQIALARLFKAINPTNEIVEFCHHDYGGLLDRNVYPAFESSRKVFVTASLRYCKARNALRRSPVQESYVERSWRSTHSLIDRCSTTPGQRFIVIDSSEQSVDMATAEITKFVIRIKGDHSE